MPIVIPRRVPWSKHPGPSSTRPRGHVDEYLALNEGAGSPRNYGTVGAAVTLTNPTPAITWDVHKDLGPCLKHNGTSLNYLSFSKAKPASTERWSIAFSFVPLNVSASTKGVYSCTAFEAISSVPHVLCQVSSSQLRFYLNGDYRLSSGITDGNFYRSILTWNGSQWEAFLNGVSIGTYGVYGANLGGKFYYMSGYNGSANAYYGPVAWINRALTPTEVLDDYVSRGLQLLTPRIQRIFIPSGGALSLSSAATLRDSDKPIATQQKAVSVDALIRASDLLIGTQKKSLSVDALLADADKLSTASRHEATLAAQLLDGDVSIATAQKSGSISGLLQEADKAKGADSKAAIVTGLLKDSDKSISVGSKAALVVGLLLDGDLLTALGSQAEAHQSAAILSGADVLIAGVTTNRTVSGKAQDGDALTVASAIDRLSAALGIDADTLTSASISARSIGALIVEGDAAVAGIQSGRLQPALLIDGDILIITSSTVAQADLAGRINLSGRYAPQVSLVGVYAPAINLKGRVH